jgi:DNA-binding NarL/FixJ family response regulator
MKISIVLADDHELVRESIASLLDDQHDFEVVGQCSNGRQLLELLPRLKPNVAIVDVSMPELNGVETAQRVFDTSPATRVIVLSNYSDEVYVRSMLEAGVAGYVIKSGAAGDLIDAVRMGARGKVFLSPEISAVAGRARNSPREEGAGGALTSREREILQLVAESFSSKEIAAKLDISETTVKTHRNNLMDKLGTRDKAGLTRHAVRLGLIRVE